MSEETISDKKENNKNDLKDYEYKKERFLSSDLIKEINLNEEELNDNINFNINPFNDYTKDDGELEDNNNSDNSDEELIFVEKKINNKQEKINLDEYLRKQSEKNINNYNNNIYISNSMSGKNSNQIENIFKLNNKTIQRIPSDPPPISIYNNNNFGFDNSFNFYENSNSFSNINLNFHNRFNFTNNSFSMNGRTGWVCPHCKNFNYESIFNFILNIFSENSM